jgi:hypothetical protein
VTRISQDASAGWELVWYKMKTHWSGCTGRHVWAMGRLVVNNVDRPTGQAVEGDGEIDGSPWFGRVE